MADRWLSIIGMGDDGALFGKAAQDALANADIVFGGERHFALLKTLKADCRSWPSPFADGIKQVVALRGTKIVVLATGDPMFYGVGSSLLQHMSIDEIDIYPAPSAFSLAASRLGWSLQDVEKCTLHGRDNAILLARLYPGARLLVLSANRQTPHEVASLLCDAGYGEADLTVFSHMGGNEEFSISAKAENFKAEIADFNTIAICCPDQVKGYLPISHGLPDDAFQHDGKLTKRDLRASALARLAPHPGAVLWDIGAGCGSVAIEWMRSHARAKAVAVECLPDRLEMMRLNANALGTPNLQIVEGIAPECLDQLETPDAIFIGGGLTSDGLLDVCMKDLKSGGRLVAHAVTLQSEAILLGAFSEHGGHLSRLSISQAVPLGRFHGWKPMMPVTQWSFTK